MSTSEVGAAAKVSPSGRVRHQFPRASPASSRETATSYDSSIAAAIMLLLEQKLGTFLVHCWKRESHFPTMQSTCRCDPGAATDDH